MKINYVLVKMTYQIDKEYQALKKQNHCKSPGRQFNHDCFEIIEFGTKLMLSNFKNEKLIEIQVENSLFETEPLLWIYVHLVGWYALNVQMFYVNFKTIAPTWNEHRMGKKGHNSRADAVQFNLKKKGKSLAVILLNRIVVTINWDEENQKKFP